MTVRDYTRMLLCTKELYIFLAMYCVTMDNISNVQWNLSSLITSNKSAIRGREPPDAISLRHADTSLPDLLGRPSLRCAVDEPPLSLCSKRASSNRYAAQPQ